MPSEFMAESNAFLVQSADV